MKKREQILESLINLLKIIEQGMLGLDEPVPMQTDKGICSAISAFEKEALEPVQRAIIDLNYITSSGYLFDILGEIPDDSSTSILIEGHKRSSYATGIAALRALRQIGTIEGYEYFASILQQATTGDYRVFTSTLDAAEACKAMGDWGTPEALRLLKEALNLENDYRNLDVIIQEIAKFPEARPFLNNLKNTKPEFQEIINKWLATSEK